MAANSVVERTRDYIASLPTGTEIHAGEIAKKFDFGRPAAASREINMLPRVRKVGRGVFVKE